jgi:acetyl-CoA carboxylase biotin carboxyl carrier protein
MAKSKKPAPARPALIDRAAVEQLAALLNETGLTEIEYVAGATRIRVSRQGQAGPAAYAALTHAAPAMAAAKPLQAPDPAEPSKTVSDAAHPGAVKSPMVGTAYLSPTPGAPAFIAVGDQVREGQTLLLVEAMKTFNEIKSPRAGTVRKILIENQQPVEFGETLVIVE